MTKPHDLEDALDTVIQGFHLLVYGLFGVAMMIGLWFVGVRLLGWLAGVFG